MGQPNFPKQHASQGILTHKWRDDRQLHSYRDVEIFVTEGDVDEKKNCDKEETRAPRGTRRIS